MDSKNGFRAVGTHSIVFALTGALALATSSVRAEPVATINGTDIDNSVFAVYAESRTRRPVGELPEENRQTLMSELVDLYVLSTQPTTADLRKDPKVAAQIELQERAIIAQAFATKFMTENEVTDQEIAAEYEIQAGEASSSQFKARHILVPTQSQASDLITQLDDGSDFATLAKEHSTGPSAKDGGDLPWFSPSQMVKPFSDAVAELEDGKYTSEPVQTEFGWHVILREETRANEPPPLESIREEVKQKAAQKKFQAHLEVLRADAASSD